MQWNDEQLDWARHGLRVCSERLQKPKWLTEQDITQLRWLVNARQSVLNYVATGLPLPNHLLPVETFMHEMADLQIARRGGKIAPRPFYLSCDLARQRLWDALKRVAQEAA